MASEEKKYSPDFKKKVALEALNQDKKNLDQLSDKYNVPVSTILMWAVKVEKHSASIFSDTEKDDDSDSQPIDEDESVDIDVTDEQISESVSSGVMGDKLNYKRLSYWSVLGMVLVAIFVIALMEMYEYNTRISQENISANAQNYDVNELNREAEETLSSFGVVDLEEGVYRIPIDSAINELAVDDDN